MPSLPARAVPPQRDAGAGACAAGLRKAMRWGFVLAAACAAAGCTTSRQPAPVEDRTPVSRARGAAARRCRADASWRHARTGRSGRCNGQAGHRERRQARLLHDQARRHADPRRPGDGPERARHRTLEQHREPQLARGGPGDPGGAARRRPCRHRGTRRQQHARRGATARCQAGSGAAAGGYGARGQPVAQRRRRCPRRRRWERCRRWLPPRRRRPTHPLRATPTTK